MKTLLYSLLLVAVSVSAATAQTEKGRWTVGVSVGNFNYQNRGDGYAAFTGNLSPSAGYFIASNLVIGTGVPLSLSTSKQGQGYPYVQKSTVTGIGLSPFVRYYFGKSPLRPYVGLSYSYVRNSSQYKTQLGDVSNNGYSSTVTPTVGIAYFVNRNVALNAGLNYNIQTNESGYLTFTGQTNPTPIIMSAKSENKSLSLNIGFQLFFGK